MDFGFIGERLLPGAPCWRDLHPRPSIPASRWRSTHSRRQTWWERRERVPLWTVHIDGLNVAEEGVVIPPRRQVIGVVVVVVLRDRRLKEVCALRFRRRWRRCLPSLGKPSGEWREVLAFGHVPSLLFRVPLCACTSTTRRWQPRPSQRTPDRSRMWGPKAALAWKAAWEARCGARTERFGLLLLAEWAIQRRRVLAQHWF